MAAEAKSDHGLPVAVSMSHTYNDMLCLSGTGAYRAALAGKRILVTGGTGYIGSHTVVQLIENGAHITVIDKYPRRAQLFASADAPLCDPV